MLRHLINGPGPCNFEILKYRLFLESVCVGKQELGLVSDPTLKGDRGKGVPSFDEMVDFALVEVDFDDPTTNVRGRRALAIAKPTPRGY